MTQVSLWFDRKFDFSFPAELHPNICARLRGTPARLADMLTARSHKTLTAKPQQKWSAQEHVGHLLDLEPLWLARVEDYVKGSAVLTVTDLQNRKTDAANYNSHSLKEILEQFGAARRRLLAQAEGIDEALFSRAIPHPRLKVPMRLADHLFFVAEHDDHHLAKIWELLSSTAAG